MNWAGRILGLVVIAICSVGSYVLISAWATPPPTVTVRDSINSILEVNASGTPAIVEFPTTNIPLEPAGLAVAAANEGSQPLEYRVEDGVKVFDLTAAPVLWNIVEDIDAPAWAYNGMVPGPLLRVTEGDRIRVNFNNALASDTNIRWRIPGLALDESAVSSGESFSYEFTAATVGSFMYEPSIDANYQSSLGLYGAIIVDPQETEAQAPAVDMPIMISEWRVYDGITYPTQAFEGRQPNYFTMNGKAYPDTIPIEAQVGETVRLHLYGIGSQFHPVYLAGSAFEVVAVNGIPIAEDQRYMRDTLLMSPGDHYTVQFTPDTVGEWILRCNIVMHTQNNFHQESEGGLIMIINVSDQG